MKMPARSFWTSALVAGTNSLFFISGAANITIGTWKAYEGNTMAAAACLGAGLLLLFSATIDRFDTLKGLGLEAKTRTLDRKIDEADRTLERLRDVTELLAPVIVRATEGRSPIEAAPVILRLTALLEGQGVTFSKRRDTFEPWAQATMLQFALALFQPVKEWCEDESKAAQRDVSAMVSPTPPNIDFARLKELELRRDLSINDMLRARTRLSATNINAYPEALRYEVAGLAILADDVRNRCLAKIDRYEAEMKTLRDSHELPNHVGWKREIDEAAASADRRHRGVT